MRTERIQLALPVVLSLGSNLGDREQTIRDAVAEIDAIAGVRVISASGFVETPAVKPSGIDDSAPAYLNAVITVRTAFAPERLLELLGEIERAHGRIREERWGDRTLDIDIVNWGGLRLNSEKLTIPHPRAGERPFVLVPWLDIEPDATLPGLGRVDALPAARPDLVTRRIAEPLL